MSESDTTFNEQGRRCASVKLMVSTDPNYDNRTIFQHPQHPNQGGSTPEGTAQRIGRPSGSGGAEGHHQENLDQGVHWKGPGNHWWNSPAVYSKNYQRFRRLTLNCEIMYERGFELLVLQSSEKPDLNWEDQENQANQVRQAPSSPTWTRWTTSFGHTSRTSPTWPPTIQKPAWSPTSPDYSPGSRRRLWKRHAPSSGSVSRRWLRLKAATLNRRQVYYIIMLPEVNFFNKSFKIKV